MPSLSVNSKRLLVILLVVLAAIAAGGITWKIGHDYDERREADLSRSLGLGVRPGLLWTLDVKRLTDEPGAVLLGVPDYLSQATQFPGVVDSPTHLIAAVGRPEGPDLSSGAAIAEVTLIGVDRADGSPAWKRSVGRVDRCSNVVTSDFIACWSNNRVIFVDTATGSIRSEMATDFAVAYVDIADDMAYVSGVRTVGDRRTVVFTGGPSTAPTSAFRRTFEMTGVDPYLAEVLPAGNVFTVSENVGGVVQYRTSAFDLDTGAKRFTFDGDIRIVGEGLFRADSYVRRSKFLLSRDGATLHDLPGTSSMVFPTTLLTRGPFAPIIVGTGAYDPRSGAPLWTDPILEWNTDQSTVRAIIGNLVIVASPSDRTIVGIDARSGRRVWQTPWRDAYWIYGGITNGRHFVFSDFTGMHSIDTKTGRIVWSVRSPRGVEPRGATVATAGTDIVRTTNLSISVWRARKGALP